MKILERGKFVDLPDREINEDEGDGWIWLHDWLTQKNTTKHIVLIFPCPPLWPTVKKMKKAKLECFYFDSSGLPEDILNDTHIVFWPSEIENFSWGRPQDIVIGKCGVRTTMISYLKEVREYIEKNFSEYDIFIKVIALDIHIKRAVRDIAKIFKYFPRRVMLSIFKVEIDIDSLVYPELRRIKNKLRIRELVILIVSSICWPLYYRAALKKGGGR